MAEVTGLENYATTENLQARISIHSYAMNPNWTQWLFEQEFQTNSAAPRILDIGCGTGALWTSNLEHVGADWSITLADSSTGMLTSARQTLRDRASYVIADAKDLPFPDTSFDIVVANHMLYHVADRPRTFAEISRVLVPGGAFHCSTNGRGHFAELGALLPEATNLEYYVEEFGLETGPEQLKPFFSNPQVQRFENSLRIPTPEPVLNYLRSSERFRSSIDLTATRAVIESEIERNGFFFIQTHPGLISSTRG